MIRYSATIGPRVSPGAIPPTPRQATVPVAETFDSDRQDYVTNNWPNPAAGGGNSVGTGITDYMTVVGGTPTPQNPVGNPTAPGAKIFHHTQHWWIGSKACDGTGCQVKTVKQTYYINCGRHL